MKELIRFVSWRWRKFETWQKYYIVGFHFFIAGVLSPSPWRYILLSVPATIIITLFFKWWIWDQIQNSWQEYKKEKQSLFETIKTSDQ